MKHFSHSAPLILLVEDESGIAEALLYIFKQEGFSVIWVQNGGEALDQAFKESPHCIVLDVGLPDLSGFEVARKIRKESEVPILFLTARNDEVDKIQGFEIGADDYIVKPFSAREVVARIKAILRRSSSEVHTESIYHRGMFSIDEQRYSITYSGVELSLSRYEYRILMVLLEHPGWVYSRDKLMQRVWETPEMSLERTVDTHIKTIRSKLREIRADFEPILTHRGVGYSIKCEP